MSRHILAVALASLVVLSACHHRTAPAPTPQNVIILLPTAGGGSSGSLVVTNAAGSQKLEAPYSAVKVVRGDTPPSAPVTLDPAEVQHLFGEILAAMPAPEARFNLYFETGGVVLTSQSAAELPKIFEAYRTQHSSDVTIIGHTDTVGDRASNYQLGLERAAAISKSIQALGVNPAYIFIESHGENDPLVPTADNVDEPRNRRVEVIVR